MTLQDAVALFLDAKRGAGKSRKTVEWYEYQLGCFLRWLDGRYTDGSCIGKDYGVDLCPLADGWTIARVRGGAAAVGNEKAPQ